MTSKEIDEILKSPITQGAKGRFISIEQLEQIKTILEAWEIAKNKSVDLYYVKTSQDAEEFNCDLYTDYQLTAEELNKLKNALELDNNDWFRNN